MPVAPIQHGAGVRDLLIDGRAIHKRKKREGGQLREEFE